MNSGEYNSLEELAKENFYKNEVIRERYNNNLNATTENAASLLEDLKEHPKRYVHFSLFGKKDK